MFLEGIKVRLRPLKESDADFFFIHLNDPEILKFISIYRPVTLAAEKEWIRRLDTRESSDVVLAIQPINREDPDQIIGTVGLHGINHKDRCATFGIAISNKTFQNKGFGPDAARLMIGYGFSQLNLRRINSGAIAFNERSIKMHLGLGFKEEGRSRQKLFRNGAYHDEVLFGLLREEWEVMKKG